jgi:hypothetical protein
MMSWGGERVGARVSAVNVRVCGKTAIMYGNRLDETQVISGSLRVKRAINGSRVCTDAARGKIECCARFDTKICLTE